MKTQMLQGRPAWQSGVSWAGIALVLAALTVVSAWLLLVPLTDWLAAHDLGHVAGEASRLQTARDAARGRLLTFGAGLFAAGALVFTARNFTLARRMFELTDRGQRRTLELTEQGQVTDRYTKAIEQLGSEKLDVRIGGIYALERIANDSERDHPTIMEVLAAFIREHSAEKRALLKPNLEFPESVPSPSPDVQAAITVIGRRDRKSDRDPINLINTNLAGAVLDGSDVRGVQLAGADLGHARLVGARLSDVDLTGADLTNADLTDADLTRAKLVYADLTEAKLAGAQMGRAVLDHALLSRADLTDSSLEYATLSGAIVARATLTDVNLRNANLSRAELFGTILIRTQLQGADLTFADLTQVLLTETNLAGANLAGANFSQKRQYQQDGNKIPGLNG